MARQLPQQPQQGAGQQLQRPSWLPETAPLVPPISQHQLDALADLLQGARNVVVLTGAGCSTESAIPDYRGPSGAYSTGFKPITHQQVGSSPTLVVRQMVWQHCHPSGLAALLWRQAEA